MAVPVAVPVCSDGLVRNTRRVPQLKLKTPLPVERVMMPHSGVDEEIVFLLLQRVRFHVKTQETSHSAVRKAKIDRLVKDNL